MGVVVWYTITTGWQCSGGVCICRDCREFIVVCECEFAHLSLSLLFLRAVYCLIQWVRNEACRKLGKMSKGLLAVVFQLVHSCHVTGCGSGRATRSGTERNGVPAMTHVINQGMSMYWGTSRWSAMEIMVSDGKSLVTFCNK